MCALTACGFIAYEHRHAAASVLVNEFNVCEGARFGHIGATLEVFQKVTVLPVDDDEIRKGLVWVQLLNVLDDQQLPVKGVEFASRFVGIQKADSILITDCC